MSRLHPFWLIEMKIEPKSKGDQEKMGVALVKLATEDPSFRVSTDQESGETIIKGMGELHLDIKVDILRRTHKVEVAVGAPRHNAPVASHDGNLPPFAPAMAMRVA